MDWKDHIDNSVGIAFMTPIDKDYINQRSWKGPGNNGWEPYNSYNSKKNNIQE